MTDESAIKILEQYREKPTLINEIETVEEAVWLNEAITMGIKALKQESTVQDKQAESEKYQKAFDDGYTNGYAQARFDYEQESCDDAISRKAVLEIFGYVMDYWKEHAIDVEPHEIEDALIEQYEFTAKQLSDLPPVTPQNTKERDTSFINKPCISIGVCHEDKIKVLDKIRTEIEQNAYPIVHGVNNHEKGMTLYGILQVIDKYRKEDKYEIVSD